MAARPWIFSAIGVASPAAVAYVNGVPDFEQVNLNQDVASASMQGTLPWGLPAGPVAVAFGAEYRTGKPASPPRRRGHRQVPSRSGNFAPFKGAYNVEEGFVEVDAPILKDNSSLNRSISTPRAASPAIRPAAWSKPGSWA